ncbi:MAG: DNA polymerase I [Candidatus Chromulinivorax sp.]
MTKKSPVFIIDGSSFLYRAYYGVRPLQTSQGVAVQAVYSFCRMIKKLIKDFNVQHLVVVWDSKGKNVRHEIFPEYKANRQSAPTDLFTQKDLILEFLADIKIAQLSQVGIEADDLIACVAKKFNEQDHPIVIVSGDKDLAQIVTNDSIKIFDSFKDKMFDEKSLTELYGFPLHKLPFYFAILGDSSDNIPGVKGIGDKGATELVNQFASLDDLYANLDKVDKRRTKELLLAQKENAYLSLQLFTLQDYPVATTIEETEFNPNNWNLALPLFEKLEFKTMITEITSNLTTNTPLSTNQAQIPVQTSIPLHEKYTFILVNTIEQLKLVCKEIESIKSFALDTETTGLNAMQNPCIGISIATQIGTAYYIPFGHMTIEEQLTHEDIKSYLGPIFANPSIKKYLHHALFDQIVLHQTNLPLAGVAFDTLIAASLLVQDWQKKGLKELSEFYFQETMISFEQISKKFKALSFAQILLKDATEYAAADAHQTLKLYYLFEEELKKQNLHELFYTIEMPTHAILVNMQIEGIFCDATILADLDKLVSSDLAKIQNEIELFTQEKINLNSPKQVKELLFDKLQLPTQKKNSKSSEFSTDAQVLHTLSKIHPVPGLLLKYRELFKLQTTYIQGLPEYINPITHKIHTSFNQTMVATGRLSSSNPNLQNIPTGNLGYPVTIRSAFKAEQGYQFLAADYSQIELRILAHLSQDQTLVQAFLENKDIHLQTAAKLFSMQPDEIQPEQRNVGKTINFSILYGLTSFGLSKSLEIPYKEAKKYIQTYFEQYPGIVTWMEKTVEFAKTHGYVETMHGRKRYVPGIYEKNKILYELAKRIAINSVVQGTASEIMKLGMIKLQQNLQAQKCNAKILLQIHDELILSVPENQIDLAKKITKESLESVVDWQIPLTIQTKAGTTWQDVTK